MPRLRLTVAYVGTRYCGWQIQDKPKAPPTIQGELEKVLFRVAGILVRVHGSGRTDSGVHAHGQVAHADIPASKAHLDWQRIFNTSLPPDISVLEARLVDDNFHCRFDALHKTYTYHFWLNRRCMPPLLRPFAWDCGPLDVARMQAALPYLMGKHDFRCLQNAGTPMEDTVRTILQLDLSHQAPQWEASIPTPSPAQTTTAHLALRVTADGFLKQMVRNTAGLLAAVGRGKFEAEAITALLRDGQRADAPPTAPACGLFLHSVAYPS